MPWPEVRSRFYSTFICSLSAQMLVMEGGTTGVLSSALVIHVSLTCESHKLLLFLGKIIKERNSADA